MSSCTECHGMAGEKYDDHDSYHCPRLEQPNPESRMSDKHTFSDGPPDVLNIKLSYKEFLDLMTDAYLVACNYEQEPTTMFRRAFFYNLDKLMKEKFEL